MNKLMSSRTTKHIRIESSYYEDVKQISKETGISMAVILGEAVSLYTRERRMQKAVEEAENKVLMAMRRA